MPDPSRVTPERFLEALHGFERTEVLLTALSIDLFTAIGEGADTAEAIGRRCGIAPRGARAIADYVVTLGFLTKDGPRYGLAADAAAFLDRRSPRYLGGTADFYASRLLRESFAATTMAVRRGGSDAGTSSMVPDHPVWVEYARAMAPLFEGPAEALADLVLEQRPPPRAVLDVAAGHGLFGIALARKVPQVVVTAVDWPTVLEVAARHAREAGVGARFHTKPGNAFALDWGNGFDVAILANFLHHFDPPTVERFLRRVHASLATHGRIAVVDFIPEPDRVNPPAVAQYALTMLVTTPAGDLYTFPELSEMLASAGFTGIRLRPLKRSIQRAVLAERT